MPDLRAGWARVRFRPPAHYPMTGYIARSGVSEGELDPLYLRALVLKQGRTCVVIVVVDLLLISTEWAARLRTRIARSIHVRAEQVIVAATHTHSGPLIDTSPFRLSQALPDSRTCGFMSRIEKQSGKVVADAYRNLAPVCISHLHCPIRDLATDRTRPGRNRIQWFDLIRFDANGSSALFGIVPCHPTILGAANQLYSGDLHGEIARRYEKQFDVALIANGAAANISTRFTRSSQNRAQVQRSAAHVLRQGQERRFKNCHGKLSLISQSVKLPTRDLRRPMPTPPTKTGRIADVAKEGALVAYHLGRTKEFRRPFVSVRIALLRIGTVSLAALPMELYLETGRFFWKKAKTAALCYANGYCGYVYPSNAGAFDYEVVSSPFTAEADSIVRRAVLKLKQRSIHNPIGPQR